MLTNTAPVCSCQPDVQPEMAVWLTWKTSTESFVRSLIGSVLKLAAFAVTPSASVVAVEPPAGPAGVARTTPLPMTVASRAKTPPMASIRRGVADSRFIGSTPLWYAGLELPGAPPSRHGSERWPFGPPAMSPRRPASEHVNSLGLG